MDIKNDMNIENYNTNKNLVQKILKEDDNYFFPIDDIPEEEVFIAFYSFCQIALNNNKHSLKNCFIYYKNNFSSNAKAYHCEDFNLISINSGLMIKLFSIFKHNESLFENEFFNDYRNVISNIDVPINEFMYQFASNFTFYHEFAHLIQKSKLLKEGLSEDDMTTSYDERRNILELDADEFSAINIAEHVLQYFRNGLYNGTINSSAIEKFLVFCSLSIFVYLLLFDSNKKELYFKEGTHPHPLIRIIKIIFTLNTHVLQVHDFIIEPKTIIDEVIISSKYLNIDILENELIDKFIISLEENAIDINKYNSEMSIIMKEDKSLAVHKRNALI